MVIAVPVGIDDFRKIREQGYTYIDKSLLIETFLDNPAEVQLITRPRRFGKTLNLSMLSYFLDREEDSGSLFQDLAIAKRPCFNQRGTYPVIMLSFKNLKASSYDGFLGRCRNLFSQLFHRCKPLLKELDPFDRAEFENYLTKQVSESDLIDAIYWLMDRLYQIHKKRVILLLDEYDSPLHEAFEHGYLTKALAFMRALLGQTLKGNLALEKAALTGILRIAKESIFSDLNHISVYSILDPTYADKFGFTEDETRNLLKLAQIEETTSEVGNWFNGYKIAGTVIYNPWSVLKFVEDPLHRCQAYWTNTSSNQLVQKQLIGANVEVQDQLKVLMSGDTITTTISDTMVFSQLQKDPHLLWSLLLFSGYLTVEAQWRQGLQDTYALKIPNKEVLLLYQNVFQDWFRTESGPSKTQVLLDALINGDTKTFETHLADLNFCNS